MFGTQEKTVKSWTMPYVQPVMDSAQRSLPRIEGLLNQNLTPWQGTQFNRDRATSRGLAGIMGLARQGPGITGNAAGMIGDTLAGKYLDPNSNPYFQQSMRMAAQPVMENMQRSVMPNLDGAFARSGAFGGSAHQAALQNAGQMASREMADATTRVAGQQYAQERGMMQQAAQMAPGLQQALYDPYRQMLGVGQMREQFANNRAQENMQRYYAQQNIPNKQLGNYQQALGNLMSLYGGGAGSATQQTMYRNPMMDALGAGLGIAGAAGQAGMGGWGAAAMGGLGALAGAFG